MGFRFQKSIKIFPGFRLNLSKSGIGWSVGPRGAKLSSGPSGTFIHASAVGTGLYYRQKISPNKGRAEGTSTRSEPDMDELARQNGFTITKVSGGGYLLAPAIPLTDTEKCPNPLYHEIVTAEGEACFHCDPDTPIPQGTCFYCDKPLKKDQYAWHESCNWINDHQLFILFMLVTGTIWWCSYLS